VDERVTACRACNGIKAQPGPEESGLELIYAPYVPKQGRIPDPHQPQILADQMEFWSSTCPPNSRVLTLAGAPSRPRSGPSIAFSPCRISGAILVTRIGRGFRGVPLKSSKILGFHGERHEQ